MNVPFKIKASLISLCGYSLMFWAEGTDFIDPYACLLAYFLFSAYYLFIFCYFYRSFYFAFAISSYIFYSENICVDSFSRAFEFAATIITMHYWVSKPRSISYYPFIYVIVSHSSNPLSISNFTLYIGKWSQSLSIKLYIIWASGFCIGIWKL